MPTTRKSSKPGGKFKKPPADSPLKTVRQVSLAYHIGQNTISKAIYAGKFPATSTQTAWIIDTDNEAFKEWAEKVKGWSSGGSESNAKRREILAKARAKKKANDEARAKETKESEGNGGRED